MAQAGAGAGVRTHQGSQPTPPIHCQHLGFVIGCVIAWLVPDIPEPVGVKMKCEQYEQYLAKEALVAE